ncbi:MAG: V4R domain-containing protein [Candidatus Jordarchaeum sp.]|uniref:V4R domain-containing protein n=1 Tax=Candidatus Jordarchaeum sp. TaxID=2823881 RepID=UPI004048FF4F
MCLREKPMSIYEISRRTGRSWRTIRDHLQRLKELGKVECFNDGAGKIWRLTRIDFRASGEQHIVRVDLMKIARNLVDARELMYYDKEPYKIRLPLIEECGIIIPLHLFETFRSVLSEKIGDEMADKILFNVGRNHGFYIIDKLSGMLEGGQQSLEKKFFKYGMTNDEVRKLFGSIYESQGWFKVINIERNGSNIIFKLQYCFESMAYGGKYPCSFMKGFLVGMMETYFHEKALGCQELKCLSEGEDYCEFSIEFN